MRLDLARRQELIAKLPKHDPIIVVRRNGWEVYAELGERLAENSVG